MMGVVLLPRPHVLPGLPADSCSARSLSPTSKPVSGITFWGWPSLNSPSPPPHLWCLLPLLSASIGRDAVRAVNLDWACPRCQPLSCLMHIQCSQQHREEGLRWPHFTDRETESWRGQVMFWRLHREEGGEPGRRLRAPESRWTFSGALPTNAAHVTFLPDWGPHFHLLSSSGSCLGQGLCLSQSSSYPRDPLTLEGLRALSHFLRASPRPRAK